jgi:hypothetical protein
VQREGAEVKIKELRKELKRIEKQYGNVEVHFLDDYDRPFPIDSIDVVFIEEELAPIVELAWGNW